MKWVVTGGVGFIGTNLCEHLILNGNQVVVIDDISREGVERNAQYLKAKYGLEPRVVDVSDASSVLGALRSEGEIDAIAHLAGQVSFMDSIANPRRDFEVNALGTLNILEFVRAESPSTAVIGMSSNKLYGDLDEIEFEETSSRYVAPSWPKGFNESLPLNFRGPYGCSKGIADQYLADYGRIFGLKTVSLRQSSVYGPHQHPRADQGWVAHLTREVLSGSEIQLNGIGKQVRDLLHVSDLARLFSALANSVPAGAGWQLNVGGGMDNSLSILELFDLLNSTTGKEAKFLTGPTRPSDQKIFVSDNSKVSELVGWFPGVTVADGIAQLLAEIASKN